MGFIRLPDMQKLQNFIEEYNLNHMVLQYISIFIVVNNFYHLYQSIYTKAFGADEFQHTHIAWNIYNNQLIYKDFFEHHGPLYGLLNGYLLNFFHEAASFDTLIKLRIISYFFGLLSLALIFLIAREVFKTDLLAYITIAVFSMWGVVQYHIIEIRPDIIQTFFALAGVFCFFKAEKKNSSPLFYISGLLLGLMIGFNCKTGIIIIAILTNQIIQSIKDKSFKSLLDFLWLSSGVLTVISIIAIYFYSHSALIEYFYYNTGYNVSFLTKKYDASRAFSLFKEFFLHKDIVLTLLFLLSLIITNKKDNKTRLIILIAILAHYGTFSGFYLHYCLLYLPFTSILIAYSILWLCNNFQLKDGLKLNTYCILLIIPITTAVYMLNGNTIRHTAINQIDRFNQTKATINWALKNTSREEPMHNLHFYCPAYIFNKDYQFTWTQKALKSNEKYPGLFYVTANPNLINNKTGTNLDSNKFLIDNQFERIKINDFDSCLWVQAGSKVQWTLETL